MSTGARTVRVIINADDLGMSTNVNRTILNLLSQNLVTSATIMANAPAFEDAAERILQHGHNSVGIHLNVTLFKPLTRNPHLKPLLDAHGEFTKKIMTIPINKIIQQAVFYEWIAQIEKVQSYGIKMSHIDSHQHIHTFPQLFLILKKVQKKFGIRKVRLSKNIYSNRMPINTRQLKYKKQLWNCALKAYYITKTTSGFTDFSTFYEVAKSGDFYHQSVEAMTHPGSSKDKEETAMLQTSWIEEMPFNVDLIDYTKL